MKQIVDYKPEFRAAFADLNKEWISKYFKMEETDYKALDHADAYIINNGGYIFWTDCTTGLPASTSINGGKVKFISSITYPIPEKGSNTKITKITT